jgi:hypothetical protein
MLRKRVKVEPASYYYWCDKLANPSVVFLELFPDARAVERLRLDLDDDEQTMFGPWGSWSPA